MRYVILTADSLNSLAYDVSNYVSEGWSPAGGPFVTSLWQHGEESTQYNQAIYLPKESSDARNETTG